LLESRTSAAVALLGVLACLSGCTAPLGIERSTADPTDSLPPLTAESILAPVDGDGYQELERLSRLPDAPSVRLRRAYIWLSSGVHSRALRELNRTIFGEPPPSRDVESFARYLRSIAFSKQGDTERSAFDRDKAAELAVDSGLRRLLAPAPSVASTPSSGRPAARVTPLLSRESWHAAPARNKLMVPMTPIDRLTVHHSAMLAESGSPAESGALMRSIQKTHMGANGWGDIGYHFVIDREGRVWEGRSLDWQGAHAGNPTTNRGNIGICLLGNFVPSSNGQSPSPSQLRALQGLIAVLCDRYRIAPDHILTHREIKPTSCPGALLQVAVERMREALLASADRRSDRARPTE
jgi:hypothetical protein